MLAPFGNFGDKVVALTLVEREELANRKHEVLQDHASLRGHYEVVHKLLEVYEKGSPFK